MGAERPNLATIRVALNEARRQTDEQVALGEDEDLFLEGVRIALEWANGEGSKFMDALVKEAANG